MGGGGGKGKGECSQEQLVTNEGKRQGQIGNVQAPIAGGWWVCATTRVLTVCNCTVSTHDTIFPASQPATRGKKQTIVSQP